MLSDPAQPELKTLVCHTARPPGWRQGQGYRRTAHRWRKLDVAARGRHPQEIQASAIVKSARSSRRLDRWLIKRTRRVAHWATRFRIPTPVLVARHAPDRNPPRTSRRLSPGLSNEAGAWQLTSAYSASNALTPFCAIRSSCGCRADDATVVEDHDRVSSYELRRQAVGDHG